MAKLPPGFTLDQPEETEKPQPKLPPGFTIDPASLKTDRERAVVEELAKRGAIQLAPQAQENQSVKATQTVSTGDPRQDAMQELASEIGPLQAFLIGTGEGMYNIGRGFGLLDPVDKTEKQAMAALSEKRPYTTGAGQIVGEAAPFVPLALATGGAASIPARMGISGTLGALEGGVSQAGREGDVVGGMLTGGSIGAGAELLFPVIGKLGRKIYQKVRGNVPNIAMLDEFGRPTPQLDEVLQETGISFEDLTDDAINVLESQGAELSPGQLARKQFLTEQMDGVEPTLAQIRRDPDLFQAQQEAAKRSSKVRRRLEQQEAALTSRFNDAITRTTGEASAPSVAVIDTVVDKATALDQEIASLYNTARERTAGLPGVKLQSLVDRLKSLRGSDRRAGGNVNAVIGDLRNKGVIDKDFNVVSDVPVDTAEDTRIFINSLYDEKNGFGNMLLRQMKDSLDDDVFSSTGDDLFNQARTAKAKFEEGLKRSKVSKFDRRRQNLVRDILENKIRPDTFVNDVVLGKSWRAEDLSQLKNYTGGGADWNNLKADVIDNIKKYAFTGAEDADGYKALSRSRLESILERIGKNKLDIIFDPEETKFLNDMLKVSRMREPVRGTVLGKGPSAQAIGMIEERLKKLPVVGALVDFIDYDKQGRMLIKAKPQKVPRKPGIIKELTRATAIPGAVSTKIQQENTDE